MDRDPRERERGVARSDAASLWIDFLLLPQKLEEHLAAGAASIPTPPDLISMFLEQALVNHKSALGNNNSSANNTINDAEPQATGKMTSRTASLLCERAARVAVVMQHTLSDIESSIPSQLHQFVLLKALIRHDKTRLLLHQCNLHRWLIHRALQSHPVGSASPNIVLPVNRLAPWVAADDLGEVFHGVMNGSGDIPSCIGDFRVEEERASVEFLEKILYEEESALKHDDSAMSQSDGRLMANGGSNKELLSTAYKCQVILDVAEVHFMRGRIRKAYELFSKCGEMVTFLSVGDVSNDADKRESFAVTSASDAASIGTLPQLLPVPQDRLAGFIIACKMLLGISANESRCEPERTAKFVGMQKLCCVGTPSPTQWAVIACERSRLVARKSSNNPSGKIAPHSDLANGSSGGNDSPSGKENAKANVSERISADTVERTLDESVCHPSSKRSKKRVYLDDTNGDLSQKESELEKVKSLDGEPFREVREAGDTQAYLDEMQLDENASATATGHAEDCLSNGSQLGLEVRKGFELELESRERRTVVVNDAKIVDQIASGIQVDILKRETVSSVPAVSCGLEVQLFVDLKGDPGDNLFPKMDNDMKHAPNMKQEKSLIQTFVEDILKGHLSWGYCLAVEKDPMLSKSVRSKLAACNVVRAVLEGAPVQSFLRTSDHFENSIDAVEFLMQLLLAIKVMQEENIFAGRRPCGLDPRQNGRLVKLGFLENSFAVQGNRDSHVSAISHLVRDFCMYVCCVIDKPWCWHLALKHRLVGQADLPRFSDQLSDDTSENAAGVSEVLKPATQLESCQNSFVPRMEAMDHAQNEILLSLMQVDSLPEIEALVGKVHRFAEGTRACKKSSAEVDKSSRKLGCHKFCVPVSDTCNDGQSAVQSDLVKLIGNQTQDASNSWSAPSNNHSQGKGEPMCTMCETASGLDRGKCSSLATDVMAILRRRAFTALETGKDVYVARHLFELALTVEPMDYDSSMMLWVLERSTEPEGKSSAKGTRDLPQKHHGDALPTFELLDFAILLLIEKELWVNLCELCKWALSLVLSEPTGRDGVQIVKSEKDSVGSTGVGATCENATRNLASWQLRQKRLLQTLNVAKTVVDLMPLCVSLQAAVSRNHFNEEVARLGSTLSQLFEEFMCVLVGIESDGQVQRTDDSPQWIGTQIGMGAVAHPGAAGVSLISKISNPRVLMALASLTAGWLQRCHLVGLTPWALAVERYGFLAGVTAGASLPPPIGPIPYPGAGIRPVPPRVPPEFGRDLFGVLLEGIVSLPGVVEGDREKGHRWLQGLADLAFEDEAFDKALRLYLQAGAIRSAQYCDRASSMNRDIFTPWVIQRMVAACRAIGAGVQAAVLCQCLPVPDHESAFRILQENTLIMDRDASAYFECLWEVPILELLVHMHSRAGDEARVSSLISLLQQPALNVHNPPAIRQAHISTMEQRFLQRLAGELL